jgi:hypothetical protein
MGWYDKNEFEYDLDVNYDFYAETDVKFETDNKYDSYVEIDEDICWDPHVEGNSVVFNVDAQAVGSDTLVDVSIVAFAVEDEYSSFTATGVVIAT